MSKKSLWKDRKELLKDLASFISRHGAFFKQNSSRMSDLFEMSVYNDVVRYYRRKNYSISAMNIGKDGAFRYKLTTSGLAENFSYFYVLNDPKKNKNSTNVELEIHHNMKVQSAHHEHIYYTADVVVTLKNGVATDKQTSGRRHSFIRNRDVITFFEAKNMEPFPAVLFGFSGVVLEIMPGFINGRYAVEPGRAHLCPSIIFSGSGSAHTKLVSSELATRYGYNVISGLYAHKSQIYSFKNLNEYDI